MREIPQFGAKLPGRDHKPRPGAYGVVFDARSVCGRTGFSACVFLTNLFALPPTLDEFFAIPREAFDSADELFDGGWRVD